MDSCRKLTHGSPMDSCHGNPSPSHPMKSICRHFPPPPQIYFPVSLLSLPRTDIRQSDGFLPRQTVSIRSDGVRLPTISTTCSTILCCTFTVSCDLTCGSPMNSCLRNPSPSDPMESVCRHFPPPSQLYFAVYVLSLSRTDSRQSDGFFPPQPVFIGSDGVRLPTFYTPSSTILCCRVN